MTAVQVAHETADTGLGPVRTTGYRFSVVCPACGGCVQHVNGTALGGESVAVARCVPCEREWMLRVYLAPLETPEQRSARERQARRRMAVVR